MSIQLLNIDDNQQQLLHVYTLRLSWAFNILFIPEANVFICID